MSARPLKRNIGTPIIFGIVACILIIGVVFFVRSPSLPRGFQKVVSELQIWENPKEGFMLTLVTSSDRVQGFLEWSRLNLYGRIVEAKRTGDTMKIILGDGGFNDLKFEAKIAKNSMQVLWLAPPTLAEKSKNEPRQETLIANKTKESLGLKIFLVKLNEKQDNRRDISIRLQYVYAKNRIESSALDQVLRRGNSCSEMAKMRKKQQEETPMVHYELYDSQKRQGASDFLEPPLVYEEIQYPVFVSKRYLSIATQQYFFNGGAHGAASTDFDVIDRATGQKLRPIDILKEGWQNSLIPALKADRLRQSLYLGSVTSQNISKMSASVPGQVPLQSLKAIGLFDDNISAPEKIFLCATGIGFEYDRYQIGPWSMGEFIVVLPWDQVEHYLREPITPF
jgi:hypothetical protein